MPFMVNYGLMATLKMRSLVFLEIAFPCVRFGTIKEGAMIFFPRMFGAFTMALKVAFPLRFVKAFTAITRGTIGAERNERRVGSTNFRRIRSRQTLSGSGTVHKRGRAHLRRRRNCNEWVSDVGVS